MKRLLLTALLVAFVVLEASAKVKFNVVAEPFTQQSVMGTDYHPAISGTSKTVCKTSTTTCHTFYGTTTCDTPAQTCDTETTPGTPAFTTESVSRVEVRGSVIGNGYEYTVSCAAHWSGSNCASLIPGSSYVAEIDKNTMWIYYRSGTKIVKAKYDIIGIEPNASGDGVTRPPCDSARYTKNGCK